MSLPPRARQRRSRVPAAASRGVGVARATVIKAAMTVSVNFIVVKCIECVFYKASMCAGVISVGEATEESDGDVWVLKAVFIRFLLDPS